MTTKLQDPLEHGSADPADWNPEGFSDDDIHHGFYMVPRRGKTSQIQLSGRTQGFHNEGQRACVCVCVCAKTILRNPTVKRKESHNNGGGANCNSQND